MTTRPDTARTGPVTGLKIQAGDPNRVSVFVNGRFSFGMPLDAASDLGIRKGTELDEDLLARALGADVRFRARQRALGFLAHRPRTEAEVRRRLRAAGFGVEVVEDTVARMVQLGYLDDEAFALAYARSRAAARGYGSARILAELLRKGLSEGTAREAVQVVEAERDPLDDAMEAGRRAWKRIGTEPDARKRRNRMYGHLARRGYDPETISRVIDALERQP